MARLQKSGDFVLPKPSTEEEPEESHENMADPVVY